MEKELLLFLLLSINTIAQSVIIDPKVTTDAIISAKSTTSGVLVPSMSTPQRTAITNPTNGLLVFDSWIGTFWYYSYYEWREIPLGSQGQWQASGDNQFSINTGNVGVGVNPTKAKFEVSASNTTQAIFGSNSTGISIQQNWPTIGFNQYRDINNTQRYIGTGYAMGNFLDPTNGNMNWNSIPSGTTGNPTPVELTVLTLKPDGSLITGLNANSKLEVKGFTKLGTESPAIKMKTLTGTTCSFNNCIDEVDTGLSPNKIISVSIFIIAVTGAKTPPNNDSGSTRYRYFLSEQAATEIIKIEHPDSNTSNSLSRPYEITVLYKE